jgi:hypothetical protein
MRHEKVPDEMGSLLTDHLVIVLHRNNPFVTPRRRRSSRASSYYYLPLSLRISRYGFTRYISTEIEYDYARINIGS